MSALFRPTATAVLAGRSGLRSSSLATSSRVQLQHFLASSSTGCASVANLSSSHSGPQAAVSLSSSSGTGRVKAADSIGSEGRRYLHGSRPLDPSPPSATDYPPPSSTSAASFAAEGEFDQSALGGLSITGKFVICFCSEEEVI
jgi:hypothetical protein